MGLISPIESGTEKAPAIKLEEEEEEEEEDDDGGGGDGDGVHIELKKKKDGGKNKVKGSLSTSSKVLIGAATIVGGAGTVALVPVLLGAAGFTTAGIAAGSLGAKMMSAAAVANGGGVAAGSIVAFLQSAGAAGLSGIATAGVATTGGMVGFISSYFGVKAHNKKKE
ncbi:interferon alpha-inducible protein 27-like protein 2 isoform X1 [Echeneis naucrates]|uniref:interferon alpha-inducible protein 27-like protein 2 isoform X1 n=1 Tax=Echeneis naucrates TaxID=173247 RepID=UPI0011135D8B|nr:interferon alpha-inducible protein 27-like protein 2 isoform X1 [Echeneis naucrates]